MHAEAEVEAGARRTTTGRSCRCPRPSRYVRAARDHRARVSTRSRHRRRRRAGPKAARLESVRDDDDRDAPDARLSDCAETMAVSALGVHNLCHVHLAATG
ncbi:hypothetical protein BDA96_01G046300 [Sorghum bicolor]|uniref:Uncharacterized protein n=1 Tax=Sorghum bicolor TaxID=4558 RepID=A0A921RWU1_SORBI|nr:hypothetical protein BDA96_01G046300 [Sorghum bicolor]